MSPFFRPQRALLCAAALGGALAHIAPAQDLRPERGLRHVDPRWHALVHATLVPAPGELVDDATIVLRDGRIVSVEPGGSPPDGARVHDLTGLTVYPGLLDAHLPVHAPAPSSQGAHWNTRVTPQRTSLDGSGPSAETRDEMRSLGFTAAATVPEVGIFRGSAAVISLGDPDDDLERQGPTVIETDVYQSLAFDPAPFRWSDDTNNPSYPSSEMGAIALIRQTLSDAEWYAALDRSTDAEPRIVSDALAALAPSTRPTFFFDADHELQSLRAQRVASEFNAQLVIVGSGTEFRRIDAIAALGVPVVAPLSFPDAPNVSRHAYAESLSLRRLMGWEQAPTNPKRLLKAGVVTALTSDDLDDRSEFHARVRTAIEHGLDSSDALAMLTEVPARLLGVDDRLGSVTAGKLAHLLVIDGELFDEESKIRAVWIGGRRYEVQAPEEAGPVGRWKLDSAAGLPETVLALEDGAKLEVQVGEDSQGAEQVEVAENVFNALFNASGLPGLGIEGVVALAGRLEGDRLHGTWVSPDGSTRAWSAERQADDPASEEDEEPAANEEEPAVVWSTATPLGAYGYEAMPPVEDLLITGATVWTGGPEGILENAALWVRDGKVAGVGDADSISVPEGTAGVDGSGWHITPGLIDCHSHTGMRGGVNEVGERVTAEVRAKDIIDPDDINWYRQLAGGLTAANQLHGSANAIGGQNSVVKLRWGAAHPDEMLFDGAPGGIKFALGENPKRLAANTGVPDEYPQTRMGVATLIRDRLAAGRTYRAAVDAGQPIRRDLELEAMGEIVAGERLVHSHSYRQDEILALCRTARDFGFKIGTFQHVLEGYKVAEAIREVALGASTFSDWWQYKFEVIDAIPHNAALMHDVGVVVSINSDSSEHARRLNTEAAKSMKYGGVDPHTALQFVTLNPAIQLGIADRVGSLEVGKDADFVLWDGDPLSYVSRPRATFIDGRRYFDRERDAELRVAAERERQRILQKLMTEVVGDSDSSDPADSEEKRSRNSAFYDDAFTHNTQRGVCGCEDVH